MRTTKLEINKKFNTIEGAILNSGYKISRNEVIFNKNKTVYNKDNEEFLLLDCYRFNNYIYSITLIPYDVYRDFIIQEKLESLGEELLGLETSLEDFNNYYVIDDDMFNYDDIKESFVITYNEGKFLFEFSLVKDSENIKDVIVRIENISVV
ncbi:hypothetical protein U729_3215 (plasmid) [Clostridium baratii str. Sullivan]|uniref:Uncharacterized protein n=1 Tax=Clostridium baratii str. Sullivan TaxID=1415775 RepID=A0A0A7G2V8_9CLOT|nr:hypothetical protein [Clostridium baratii]AIY85311.1 hypothetical protein U729_3215 [Clostridium baratii str. Sullivan]